MRQNTAVVCIDMQPNFIAGLLRKTAHTVIAAQLEILDTCRKENIPVVLLQMKPYRHGRIIPVIKQKARLVPRSCIISKGSNGGFRNTILDRVLTAWGIDELFLTGINAACCVQATGSQARAHGYSIVTTPAAIASLPHHDEETYLAWYAAHGTVAHSFAAYRGIPTHPVIYRPDQSGIGYFEPG